VAAPRAEHRGDARQVRRSSSAWACEPLRSARQRALDRWCCIRLPAAILLAVLLFLDVPGRVQLGRGADGMDRGRRRRARRAGRALRAARAGLLRSLLVDGIIAGVGSVLVFLPQILILFFFILVLEDSGYLPRAAFLLDRLMGSVGLSGRAFIPLLSSFACAIPGIMATRTIPNPRDRSPRS
jgi:ferrous iron transport protein B